MLQLTWNLFFCKKNGYYLYLFVSILGPFRYLDVHGAAQLVNKMKTLEGLYGQAFTPCQLLLDHANDSNKKFHK